MSLTFIFVFLFVSFKTTRTAWPGKAFVLYTLYSLYTVQLYSTNMLQECTNLSRKHTKAAEHVAANDESDKGNVAQSVYNREV